MIIGYTVLLVAILLQGILYILRPTTFTKNFFLGSSLADLLFLAACRSPSFVADDMTYLQIFWGRTSCYFEWGLCQLNHLISLFSQQTYVYFGILALCVMLPIWSFIRKYSCNVVISVLCFVCLMYMFNAVNIVRQFLALAIVFSSLHFVIQRKFWKFFAYVLIASLFHRSAVICLSFYWLYTMKVSLKNVGLLFITSISILILYDHFAELYVQMDGLYSRYLVHEESARMSNIVRVALNAMITCSGILTLLYVDKDRLKQFKLNMNFLTLCSCVSTAAALISLKAHNAERIAYYFYLFNIITLPQLLYLISNKALRQLFCLVLLCCLFAYGAIVLLYWQKQGIIYTFFWSAL